MPQVEYQVLVSKTGQGAALAAAELKTLQGAAATANTALGTTTPAMGLLATNTRTVTTAMKSMTGALQLAGLQSFPQLTSAAMLAKNSIDALRASGTQLQLNFTTVTAGVVGLAAAVTSAAMAWAAYAAEKNEAMSSGALNEQTRKFADDLRAQLESLVQEGKILKSTRDQLFDKLGSVQGNQDVRGFIRETRRGNAPDQLADFLRQRANDNARAELKDPRKFNDIEESKTRALRENVELVTALNFLEQEGLMTSEQAAAAKLEADTAWMSRLTQLRQQLTEVQKLGRSVTENFASGLAGALVSAFTEGGKALQQFFVQFMAQTAQMIIQLLILRALRSAFGLEGGGAVFAAKGGFFPTYAANGLAGVQAVSQATYFPKFNVVAGEAGREMLTVLARPKFMEVGGVEAVVGNAGPNRLAITNADALAGRSGAGGTIVIQVQGTPDFEARVVSNSVKGARVQVANDMRTDSPISRGVKGLTS